MKIVTGNLWSELGKARYILVSTCAVPNQYGDLVMGKGAALELKILRPLLPGEFGRQLAERDLIGKPYGVLLSEDTALYQGCETVFGAFQSKKHWKHPAELELIRYSTECLRALAEAEPTARFALNSPGVGLGGLLEEQVLPILASLPDNCVVYKR